MHLRTPASSAEAELLDSQLVEVDAEIHALLTKRAKVRYRYNALAAPTSALPPETLADILQYVCDLPDIANLNDEHLAVAMGSVSVHWRQVAHSTPAIWNRVCVFVKKPKFMSASSFSLLQLYMKNVRNQTINLRLSLVEQENDEDDEGDDEDEPDEGDVPIATVFDYVFKQNATKLNAFYMNDFTEFWARVFMDNVDLACGFPNLKNVHMGWRYLGSYYDRNWTIPPLEKHLLPLLTNVSFAQTAPPFLIPHEQITDLHFEDIAVDKCLQVMAQCPNATELHIFAVQPPLHEHEVKVPTRPVTLNRTTCLGWTFGLQKWDIDFLKLFTFPALERFRCEDQGQDGLEEDEGNPDAGNMAKLIKEFLARCPKLTVYERASEDNTNWSIDDICDNLPTTIEELYIRNTFQDDCEAAIKRLTRSTDYTADILPKLKVVELYGEFWSTLKEEQFNGLAEMVESRMRKPREDMKDHVRFEELGLMWDSQHEKPKKTLTEEQEARLQGLVNQGLKLTTSSGPGEEVRIWSRVRE